MGDIGALPGKFHRGWCYPTTRFKVEIAFIFEPISSKAGLIPALITVDTASAAFSGRRWPGI